jgi:hypothetical protein
MRLTAGSTLEVGSIAGERSDYWLLRCFAAPEGDADMDETLVVKGRNDQYTLLLAVDRECTALLELGRDRWLAVAAFGDLLFIDGVRATVREVPCRLADVPYITAVRDLQTGGIVATGLRGALLRLDGEDWAEIAPGRIPADLFDVEGTPDGRLWFAGSNGCLGSFDGGSGVRLHDLPTNLDLHSLAIRDGSELVVGGARGTVLLGEGRRWREIDTSTDEDVTAVRRWGEAVFLSAGDRVLRLDGEVLVVDGRFVSADLQVAGGSLWSLGTEGVRVREGDAWRAVNVTTDVPDRGPTAPRRR